MFGGKSVASCLLNEIVEGRKEGEGGGEEREISLIFSLKHSLVDSEKGGERGGKTRKQHSLCAASGIDERGKGGGGGGEELVLYSSIGKEREGLWRKLKRYRSIFMLPGRRRGEGGKEKGEVRKMRAFQLYFFFFWRAQNPRKKREGKKIEERHVAAQ